MDDKKLLFIVNPRAGKTKSLAPLFDAAAIYSEAGYLEFTYARWNLVVSSPSSVAKFWVFSIMPV